MALTGLEIFKLLPNKNCNECGVPTCLAFAMKLAAKAAEPTLCPYISDEALEVLGASQAPPIQKVTFSQGDTSYDIGAETVQYRHDKTFVNQCLVALDIEDGLDDAAFTASLDKIKSYEFERVGEQLVPECVSLSYTSGDVATYVKRYRAIQELDRILILSRITPEVLEQVKQVETNPGRLAVNSITMDTFSAFSGLISGTDIKAVLEADSLEGLFDLSEQAVAAEIKNCILKPAPGNVAQALDMNVTLRRLALNKSFKPAGFPILTECGDELFTAVTGVCKYSSVLVLKKYDGATLFPLLTLRQNIYTDPQKPLQIQPEIYTVGEPGPDSPFIVTTNFSLTYFIVSGEIESSPFNAHLLVTDSEGMSVLTAWSANKFSPELIAKSIQESGIAEKLDHKKVIIPGYVAVLQGELEDELKDWEVLVGPQESADLPQYLKETWN